MPGRSTISSEDTSLLTDEQCADIETLVALEQANRVIENQRRTIKRYEALVNDYKSTLDDVIRQIREMRRAMK